MSNNIRVLCRFRPQNRIEREHNAHEVVTITGGTHIKIACAEGGDKNFNFDSVYTPSVPQSAVFEDAALPTIHDLFKGYNGTIFVYGQTGSGKTHTMMGPDGGKDMDNPEMKGIVPRMINTIFDIVGDAPEELEFLVKVSYIEIYMEKIRDLLDSTKDNLRVREDKTHGVWIEGATETYVARPQEVLDVLHTGVSNRAVAFTKMNAESSRSHSVFILTVMQKNVKTGGSMNGKLYFVDLAGSEKVGKTGASGQTLEEAKTINKSLSALGNVINALTDGKSKHVPYRDSKLTRILQESLGGNSRTTLIINCSPSSYNEIETISTLRFGERAKSIKNRAKVNQERSAAELQAALDRSNEEIRQLKIYIAGLEEELYTLRGDTPTIVPSGRTLVKPASLLDGGGSSSNSSAGDVDTPARHGHLDQLNALTAQVGDLEAANLALVTEQDRLRDELAEKESALDDKVREYEELQARLAAVLHSEDELKKSKESLISRVAELMLNNEKMEYLLKEKQISIDTLQEENSSLTGSNAGLQTQVSELRASIKTVREEERARMKEHQTFKIAKDLEALAVSVTPPAAVRRGRSTSFTNGVATEEAEQAAAADTLRRRIEELEADNLQLQCRLATAVPALPGAVDGVDGESEATEGGAHSSGQDALIASLQTQLTSSSSRYETLRTETQRRFDEFEILKNSLIRDLQNRCEKVIDLQMLLDELREKYENLVGKSNNKELVHKNSFLEKNLELLRNTHNDFTQQIFNLRIENSIAKKKLENKDDRITQLEGQLGGAEERLKSHSDEIRRLQEENAELKRQQQEAAAASSLRHSPQFSRIARPIRGGTKQETAEASTEAKPRGGFWSLLSSSPSAASSSSPVKKAARGTPLNPPSLGRTSSTTRVSQRD